MTANPYAQRRFGRVFISSELMKDWSSSRLLFAAMTPLRMIERFEYGDYEIVGFSPKFDPIGLGEMAPEYRLIIRRPSQVEPAYVERVEKVA